ncbi:MAG: F0F1 ATP synthase subunit alpha, partial [Phyllobacterium sp.]|nr:F0F1 ATP synthase subunit alpha [Phyllobacterium sp.]
KLAVNQVSKFEQGRLTWLRTENKDVLDAIAKEKQLSDDIKGKLKAAVDAFAKSFA